MLLSSLPTIRSLYFNFKRFPSINTSTFAAFKSTISLKSPTSKPVPLNKSNDFRSSLYIQRTARYPPVTMPSPIDIHLSAFKSTLPTLEAQLDQLILSARARCQSLSFDKSSLVCHLVLLFFYSFDTYLLLLKIIAIRYSELYPSSR